MVHRAIERAPCVSRLAWPDPALTMALIIRHMKRRFRREGPLACRGKGVCGNWRQLLTGAVAASAVSGSC